jgi:hypothetical protein
MESICYVVKLTGAYMSRTYKDKPAEIRFPALKLDKYERIPYVREYIDYYTGIPKEYNSYYVLQTPGVLPKKRKNVDTEYHWSRSAPQWFVSMFMNRPERRKWRKWENKVLKEDIETTDYPNHKPPYIYWW